MSAKWIGPCRVCVFQFVAMAGSWFLYAVARGFTGSSDRKRERRYQSSVLKLGKGIADRLTVTVRGGGWGGAWRGIMGEFNCSTTDEGSLWALQFFFRGLWALQLQTAQLG